MKDDEAKGCFSGIGFILLVILFGIATWRSSVTETTPSHGVVVEKSFVKGRLNLDTGFTSRGDAVFTDTSTRDRWIVVFDTADGPQGVEVSRQAWGVMQKGQTVALNRNKARNGTITYSFLEGSGQ